MADSLFQHTSKALGKVNRRKQEYKNSQGVGGKDYYKAKTRRNAYAKVTVGSLSLPRDGGGYDDLYSNSSGKPSYILNSVTYHKRGDMGMLHQLDVSFTCLSRAAFSFAEKEALRPGKSVSVKYGYTDGSDSNSVSGFETVKYNFSLNNKNQYECSFTAYGPAPFARKVPIDLAGKGFGNKKFSFGTGKQTVATLPTFVKWYAQGGGKKANVDLKAPIVRGAPLSNVLILDDPTKMVNDLGKIGKQVYKYLQDFGLFAADGSKIIYITMRFFCAILNKYFLGPNVKNGLDGVELVCNSTVSTGANPIPILRSADPYKFVLSGGKGGKANSGDYHGEEYWDGSLKCARSARDAGVKGGAFSALSTSGKVDCSKILISHTYLQSRLFGKQADKAVEEANDKSQKIDGKDTAPKYTLENLMNTLFADLADATGGIVQMGLMQDPFDGPGTKKINVICKNNDPAGIKVTTFDPINGDGITRSCTVTADIPSDDAYAVANGGTTGGSGHTADRIAGRTATTNTTAISDAKKVINELCPSHPNQGKGMADVDFSPESVDSLKKALKTLHDNAKPADVSKMSIDEHIWPLQLQIKIDGTEGFTFGDVVGTTFMPSEAYSKAGVSFVVLEVTETIANNDWETTLKTQCHMFPKQ